MAETNRHKSKSQVAWGKRRSAQCGLTLLIPLSAMVLSRFHVGLSGPDPTLFYVAILAVSALGGFVPGLVATAASTMFAAVWVLPHPISWRQGVGLGLFISCAVLMSAVAGRYRRRKALSGCTVRQEREELLAKERALRASEARFRAAVGAVSSLIWTNNPRGQMEGEQPGWANFTGQTYDEYQGYGWSKAVHPEDAQPTINAWSRAVAEKQMFEFKHRLRRRDGEWRLCSIRAVPVFGEGGEITEWVGVHTDITEGSSAEEALRQSEERYRAFIANSSEGVWRMEFEPPIATSLAEDEQIERAYRQGRMAECNDAMARMYGLARAQELIGATLEFMLPAADPQAREFIASVIRAGYRVTDAESAERDARGNPVFFENSMTGTIENGYMLRMWGTQRDITQRKRTEEALRESEAVLRSVTNEARVGLVMVNQEQRYLFANHAFAELLGLPDANIIGQRVSEVLFSVYDQLQPRLARAFAGERVNSELHLPKHSRTGDERFYEVVYEPRVQGTSNPYVVMVLVDITERKKMQQILERTVAERTAKLQETVEELEAFSYSIAHDMRAPLRAMQGFSTLLQDEHGAQLDGEAKEYLRRIASSANRLDALIHDVLNYSRIVRSDLPLQPVNTVQFIREIIESYPNLHAPKAQIQVREPIPRVLANPAAFTQVVSNLLGNAVKFVRRDIKPVVRVQAETRPDGMVRLWFEDNGIGITKAMQDRIFRMFQRLNPPEQFEGTGIGLSIVRKAVERMGGRAGVESEPGEGSRFWIELKPTS